MRAEAIEAMKRIVPLGPDQNPETVCDECGAPALYLVEFADGTTSLCCTEHLPLPTADGTPA